MKHTAIGILCIVVLGSISSAIALDRRPDEAELQKIELIRRSVEDKGFTWEAGPTSVSHLSEEEFRRLLGLSIPPGFAERYEAARRDSRLIKAPAGMYLPAILDWRAQGGVTSVKNQGACGSCWAFSAAAAFESRIKIYSGPDVNLSEQAVLSCNTVGDGCNGGWMETAYDIWIDHGAVSEVCMPYHEVDSEPCTRESCDVVDDLDGYYYIGDTVDDLKTALLNGPVAAAMAVCGGFSAYTGGCYEDICTEINHGVTIVGWDDTMCGGEGAWIVKNSWGTDWGDEGYVYMKYGTCYIGYGAAALSYTPDQTVHFFNHSLVIDDTSGDGDGNIETGEVINLATTILNIGAETATNVTGLLEALTPGVGVVESLAAYPDIPKGETRESTSPHFAFTVTPAGPPCGPVRLHLTVSSDQGVSGINIVLQAGEIVTVMTDDFETDQGWTVGDIGDGAVTGIWERGDPDPTWWGSEPCQPGDDHTASPGTRCYVTGLAGGSSQGNNDVDGGKTTLISPAIDLAGKNSALLSYYRWYASETGSNPNDDDFIVDVTDDGGTSWVNLETVSCSARKWTEREFYIEDYINLTEQVRIRFIAEDAGAGGSIVEAAVDDVRVLSCGEAAADTLEPLVAVIAPDGGETCTYHTDYEIQWDASDNMGIVAIDILLSTDGGTTFPDTIASGEINDGYYTWFVPDIDSREARVRIVARDGAENEGEDISAADFILWGSKSGAVTPEPPEGPDRVMLEVRAGSRSGASSRIVFGLPAPSFVSLDIYDVTGRFNANLLAGQRSEGFHTLDLDNRGPGGPSLGPGIYFLRLSCDGGAESDVAKLAVSR